MSASRPVVIALLALFVASGRPAPSERIVAGFDLLGWLRAGAVTMQLPPLETGGVEAILDGDVRTLARAVPAEDIEFELAFTPPQVVRRVEIVTGAQSPALVGLTVVEANGGRFSAGEVEAAGGQEIEFRLKDVPTAALRIRLDALDPAAGAALADVAVAGQLEILGLALGEVPESMPVDAGFAWRIEGRDSFGGRPDLSERAQLSVAPALALSFAPERRVQARIMGPVSIEAHLGSLRSMRHSLMVTGPDVAPPAPIAVAGHRSIMLQLVGEPPFTILRRRSGEKRDVTVGRTERGVFHDDDVEPGVAYNYRCARTDRYDNLISGLSDEARVRSLARLEPGVSDVGRVPVLVALFVDSLPGGSREELLESLHAGAAFIYRHTRGRLVLDLIALDVPGPTPVTSGPTMVGIEQRLRELGLRDGQFGAVWAVAGDLSGAYGGFRLLGNAAGAMGHRVPVPTPAGAMGPDAGAAWAFVHEVQHALGGVLAELGHPVPSGHFAEDVGPIGLLGSERGRPFDAGEAWDGTARALALGEGWSQLEPPWRRVLEVRDSDGDGLADDDARLPMDELRFGSDPLVADTDGDGLSDFGEYAAGLYRGSDPRAADTDGDGTPDGADAEPLAALLPVVPRVSGGEWPFEGVPRLAGHGTALEVGLGWNPDALYVEVFTPVPSDVYLDLDGSGRLGRWESDANLGSAARPASDVWCGPARISLRGVTEPRGVRVGDRLVPGARVSAEAVEGGWRLRAVLPAALGPGADDARVLAGARLETGLRLVAGTTLGLALTTRPARADDPEPLQAFAEGTPWISLFETHRLVDLTLR